MPGAVVVYLGKILPVEYLAIVEHGHVDIENGGQAADVPMTIFVPEYATHPAGESMVQTSSSYRSENSRWGIWRGSIRNLFAVSP